MSRLNLQDSKTEGMRLGPRTIYETGGLNAAGAVNVNSPSMIMCSPTGAVNVTLPPSSGAGAAEKGQTFIFVNLSGNVVTLQTSGGAAFTTAITVAANAATRVVCTGSTTAALGWVIW